MTVKEIVGESEMIFDPSIDKLEKKEKRLRNKRDRLSVKFKRTETLLNLCRRQLAHLKRQNDQ